jgi:hypothetical protein
VPSRSTCGRCGLGPGEDAAVVLDECDDAVRGRVNLHLRGVPQGNWVAAVRDGSNVRGVSVSPLHRLADVLELSLGNEIHAGKDNVQLVW